MLQFSMFHAGIDGNNTLERISLDVTIFGKIELFNLQRDIDNQSKYLGRLKTHLSNDWASA